MTQTIKKMEENTSVALEKQNKDLPHPILVLRKIFTILVFLKKIKTLMNFKSHEG